MRKEYKYKLQGNGKHSWTCRVYDEKNVMIEAYMVYEGEDEYIKNESTLLALIPVI